MKKFDNKSKEKKNLLFMLIRVRVCFNPCPCFTEFKIYCYLFFYLYEIHGEGKTFINIFLKIFNTKLFVFIFIL
jgi:hypothetical protein